MSYTDKQHQEFTALVKPVMAWLEANCNPHVTVLITSDAAELMSGEICVVKRPSPDTAAPDHIPDIRKMVQEPCETCGGDGQEKLFNWACYTCNGTGKKGV